ncbi:PilZ domain-containing protein [Rhizobium wenxiniae]|nr:PilZ domain-containing protein [Rhizobium wenxiniae]MBW9086819.1 PilZ domain-containing protein [Rhizobium wenxiniae]
MVPSPAITGALPASGPCSAGKPAASEPLIPIRYQNNAPPIYPKILGAYLQGFLASASSVTGFPIEIWRSVRVHERKFPRSRAFLGAKILFNDHRSAFDGIVKEMSEGGAMIRTESAMSVPENFTLQLSDGRQFQCDVRWRRINAIGVEFRTD